ncbi:hypothetical protein GCM10023203_31230 [Actinomycetospora straminea]|uniref:ATP-dependent DNA ligase family profile domain-containing protein n=1 Tax=Actinomycetospora straminea TaxID=663607 RepID=A0ABP9EJN3_9PSEU
MAAARLLPPGLTLDGELVIAQADGVHFAALQQRLRHSAPAGAAMLAAEVPAALVAFDILEHDGRDLRAASYDERRQVLEDVLLEAPRGVGLMPMTTDPDAAGAWLHDQPPGIEGVVAKRRDQRYRPGVRGWQNCGPAARPRPSSAACSAPSISQKLWFSAAIGVTGSGSSGGRARCRWPRARSCGDCCDRMSRRGGTWRQSCP